MRDIGRAEHARGKADKAAEQDEDDVEVVDDDEASGFRPITQQKHEGGRQAQEARGHVEPRLEPIAWQYGQQRSAAERDPQERRDRIEWKAAHPSSPRNRSITRTST